MLPHVLSASPFVGPDSVYTVHFRVLHYSQNKQQVFPLIFYRFVFAVTTKCASSEAGTEFLYYLDVLKSFFFKCFLFLDVFHCSGQNTPLSSFFISHTLDLVFICEEAHHVYFHFFWETLDKSKMFWKQTCFLL